ncbi:MAG: hypothetical protein CLLPBCKN_004005 [Chroococcidiopsis cubana SAG 39.79]|jgi:hypothetical protein|uniref:Uncharacterized protein n=1 Tax=Chroococcidiopsis cubana SAG 39.79 TaxID=388085 RepID=A0AB37UFU4_9CYAN|nr:hypothetical protein [Chroococcidiopsis cubana SAG 39.79]PSB60609.1 hypothetical protein C7B79_25110 [Chroococcidiopsis cubana CCALA 043]RUT09357.1 hypothetical protein DSM107010_45600 [Chroococcidiopsis cubana SAG 39.79]
MHSLKKPSYQELDLRNQCIITRLIHTQALQLCAEAKLLRYQARRIRDERRNLSALAQKWVVKERGKQVIDSDFKV